MRKPLKIAIVSTSLQQGGAAIAARRLTEALQRETSLQVKTVTASQRLKTRLRKGWERLGIALTNGFKRKGLFAVSTANTGGNIAQHRTIQEADIIHLHWINQGFVSLKEIAALVATGKPIVWTMHDMWPLTGICHHAGSCNLYQQQCGHCPFLGGRRQNDLSASIFAKKRKIYTAANIHFITCSQWLSQRVEKSALLQQNTLSVLPNPLDTDYYAPGDKKAARETLGLPTDKTILLFGAACLTDARKGIHYLREAITRLTEENRQASSQMHLLLFGEVKEPQWLSFTLPHTSVGYISSEAKMRTLYQAADLYITTSLEENLPNTIMEAMSCGVPTVAFAVGGIPEMITHQKNGYLATYCDAADVARGIVQLSETDAYPDYATDARQQVVTRYSRAVVAREMETLYHQLIPNT